MILILISYVNNQKLSTNNHFSSWNEDDGYKKNKYEDDKFNWLELKFKL